MMSLPVMSSEVAEGLGGSAIPKWHFPGTLNGSLLSGRSCIC